MTTRKNSGNQPATTTTADPSGSLQLANREKKFQQKVEKMQIAVATRVTRYKKAIAAGLKELANTRKINETLIELGIKPLSDYGELKVIYEEKLKPITADDLMREAAEKAAAFAASGNKVTPAQEKLAKELYELEAKTNQHAIEHVRDFLILQGEIKSTPADAKRMKEQEEIASEDDTHRGSGQGAGGQSGSGLRAPVRRQPATV